MPMTWYVVRGGDPLATDASEAYGVSAAVEPGELCEAVSTGGELVVADSALAGVGDAATDGVFG